MYWGEFDDGAVGSMEAMAPWETMRLEAVESPSIPAPAVVLEGATPLFDQLASLWHEQKRQVPGEPDPEWHALVSRGPGRRRRPSDPRWSASAW